MAVVAPFQSGLLFYFPFAVDLGGTLGVLHILN